MGGVFRWINYHRLLVPLGIVVVLLGAFVPWPDLIVAGLVVVIGAVMMLVQIPLAIQDERDHLAAEQGEGEELTPYQPPDFSQQQMPWLTQSSPELAQPFPLTTATATELTQTTPDLKDTAPSPEPKWQPPEFTPSRPWLTQPAPAATQAAPEPTQPAPELEQTATELTWQHPRDFSLKQPPWFPRPSQQGD